jgi:predicted acyl esterase
MESRIYGVSYDGMTAGMTLLRTHPALAVVSSRRRLSING